MPGTNKENPPKPYKFWKGKDNSGLPCTDICINRVSWQQTQTRAGFSDTQNRNKLSAEQNKGHNLPRRGQSHCQQRWHHWEQGEKREVVFHQRPSLTTQHFCNLRNSPRRKTNWAWEPTWAYRFDANRIFSNICICAFSFFFKNGTVCRHFLCSKVGLPGERTQLPWHR